MSGDVTPDLALILLQGSRKTILNLSVGHRPVGIDRVLSHLPPKVLPAESYCKLVDLLNDPAPAKFLHHTASITEPIITGLHNLPPVLQTAAIMARAVRPSCAEQTDRLEPAVRLWSTSLGRRNRWPGPARPSRRQNQTGSQQSAVARHVTAARPLPS
jgi:hypothetical protein